jgi:pyruvate dehydrogenase E2 component (dihydrolipoamide acetyltransferase)
MSDTVKVNVPDIGDFEKVPVIEVLVSVGDTVEKEQSLVTLESDKATMEVPAPVAGVVASLDVALNDEVSEGDLILTITPSEDQGDADENVGAAPSPRPDDDAAEESAGAAPSPRPESQHDKGGDKNNRG